MTVRAHVVHCHSLTLQAVQEDKEAADEGTNASAEWRVAVRAHAVSAEA